MRALALTYVKKMEPRAGRWICWNDVKTPQEHLTKSKWILENFMPLEAERYKNAK